MIRKLEMIVIALILVFSMTAYAEETNHIAELRIDKIQEATDAELAEALRRIEAEQYSRLKARLELNIAELNLPKGGKEKLTPQVLDIPADVSIDRYEWKSTDEAAVNVDAKGNITAVSPGEGKIVCTCVLSNGFVLQAECNVKVYIPVSRIAFRQQVLKIARKTSMGLELTIIPDNATDKTVLFESSDPGIVSVSENGIMTANDVGTCTITAVTQDGSGKTASIRATVVQEVQAVSLELPEGSIAVGKSVSIKGKTEPETAANRKLAWSSENESVASVDKNGKVTGKGPGRTIITAKTTDGTEIESSIELTVIQPLKKIAVQDTSIILAKNTEWKQSYNVEPENATEKGIHWISSNENIATVNGEGTITGKSEGKCIITGSAADGMGATVKIAVEVKAFDYVLTEPEEISVEFPTDYDSSISMGVTNRGVFRRQEERITDFGKNGCVKSEHSGMIIPVKPGADAVTVTWKVNNRVVDKKKYTVYVAQSAVE